jgi:amphi-Trp domain-containing protein
MDLVEIETKERMTREQAAARLHELADHLARHNDLEFARGRTTFRVRVPDEVDVKVEFEAGDDGSELEIELSW